MCFPRLYAAASLKPYIIFSFFTGVRSFPRLYAAASLKQYGPRDKLVDLVGFSAALCRGLIEAAEFGGSITTLARVFRGFMPRPH